MNKLKTNPTLYGESVESIYGDLSRALSKEPVEPIYDEPVESISTISKLAIYHEHSRMR